MSEANSVSAIRRRKPPLSASIHNRKQEARVEPVKFTAARGREGMNALSDWPRNRLLLALPEVARVLDFVCDREVDRLLQELRIHPCVGGHSVRPDRARKM